MKPSAVLSGMWPKKGRKWYKFTVLHLHSKFVQFSSNKMNLYCTHQQRQQLLWFSPLSSSYPLFRSVTASNAESMLNGLRMGDDLRFYSFYSFRSVLFCSFVEPPKFETIMEDVDVVVGETSRLAVVVEGKPEPDILWYKVRYRLEEWPSK